MSGPRSTTESVFVAVLTALLLLPVEVWAVTVFAGAFHHATGLPTAWGGGRVPVAQPPCGRLGMASIRREGFLMALWQTVWGMTGGVLLLLALLWFWTLWREGFYEIMWVPAFFLVVAAGALFLAWEFRQGLAAHEEAVATVQPRAVAGLERITDRLLEMDPWDPVKAADWAAREAESLDLPGYRLSTHVSEFGPLKHELLLEITDVGGPRTMCVRARVDGDRRAVGATFEQPVLLLNARWSPVCGSLSYPPDPPPPGTHERPL